jgi:hypothetical protein
LTTIGYGDVVPDERWRGHRRVVMFASVATVSFATAVVTRVRRYQQRRLGPRPSATRSSSSTLARSRSDSTPSSRARLAVDPDQHAAGDDERRAATSRGPTRSD